MAYGLWDTLNWLTTTVKRLCCAVKELQAQVTGGVTKIVAGTNVTLSPTSGEGEVTINVQGGGYTIVNVITTTYNATQTSGTIVLLVDAATAAGNVTVNLPTAVGNTAEFIIKKIDSGVNTVTIDGSGAQTIDGTATKVTYTQYVSLSVVSDNSNWFII